MRKTLSALAIALAFAVPARASAAPAVVLPAAEARAVQRVVRAQLDAFAADDASRAFALASPEIRRSFNSAAEFMRMVRDSYPVVYRHSSAVFFKPLRDGREVVLAVRMGDADGETWLAVYRMQRLGHAWRIAGCVVGTERGLGV